METSLEDIRKKQHCEYLKKKWLPGFYKKWEEYMKTINNKTTKFNNYLKDNYFKPVKNLSNIQLNKIPWEYQLRFKLTHDNLIKPEKPTLSPSYIDSPIKSNYIPPPNVNLVNPQLEYDKAINLSLDEKTKDDWNNFALNIAIMDSLKQKSYNITEEKLLQKVILESMSGNTNSEQLKFDDDEKSINVPISYYIIVDLRVYGKDPYQSIYIDNIPFYLNKEQIEIVNSKWKLVNFASSGTYKQDLEYIYTCCLDGSKNNIR